MSVVKKIVLTGGPCAGKTSCKSRIFEAILKTGYIPIFISETATDTKISGIDPIKEIISTYNFQLLLAKEQISKENNYIEILEKDDNNFVLIFDRGLLDSKVYMDDIMWENLKGELNLTESDIYQRYDVVLHLVSASCGAEDFYTTSNNEARSENLETAKEVEKKTKEAYYGFPYIYYFGNETTFDQKMDSVISTVLSCIGKSTPIFGSQKKYLVSKVSNEELEKLHAQLVNITQCYINTENDECEGRIRIINYNGNKTFYYTEKDKKRYVTKEKIITEEEYLSLLKKKIKGSRVISKNRWYFEYNNLYFQYDEFKNYLGNAGILEIITTEKNKEYDIPDFFKNNEYYDITNDKKYTNYSISKSNSIKTQLGNIPDITVADIEKVMEMRNRIDCFSKEECNVDIEINIKLSNCKIGKESVCSF